METARRVCYKHRFPGLSPHSLSQKLGDRTGTLYSDRISQQLCRLDLSKHWMRMSGAGKGDGKKVSDLPCNLLM